MNSWPRLGGESGASLVELLVAIVLMGIVGSMVTTTMVTSMRVQRQQVAHVDALAELKMTFERLTRDVRAADPILLAQPGEITANVCQTTFVSRNYRLEVDGSLVGPNGAALARNLDYPVGTTPFTYLRSDGSAFVPGADPLEIRDVKFVVIRLRRHVPETDSWIDQEDRITIRNSGANPCP